MADYKSTYRMNEILDEILDTIKKDKPDEWLTIRQVVNYTKLSAQTIRRYIRAGRIKVSKETGRLLFKKSYVDKWLNG